MKEILIKFKKPLIILLSVFLISILGFSFISYRKNNINANGILFIDKNNPDCIEAEKYIENINNSVKKRDKNFNIEIKSIDDISNKYLLEEKIKKYNVEDSKKDTMPILFINNNYFIGYNSIRRDLYTYIDVRMK